MLVPTNTVMPAKAGIHVFLTKFPPLLHNSPCPLNIPQLTKVFLVLFFQKKNCFPC